MARRKKEPQNIHRKNISGAAEQLFMKKGIISLCNSHVECPHGVDARRMRPFEERLSIFGEDCL